MIFLDEFKNKIDPILEKKERRLANTYIEKDDVVLELGARYGTVSCTINNILSNKLNQVSVEPDERVWEALEQNKKNNNSSFRIIKGFISNKKLSLYNKDTYYGGYGATSRYDEESNIPIYTIKDIEYEYNLTFNTLVADCEGCLERFISENRYFVSKLRLIIFEADRPNICDYSYVRNMLKDYNFNEVENGHQNVWIKTNKIK